MPETPAEKARRYRARKAGRLTPLPTCPTCSRRITGAGRDGLCSRCWAITPEGRADLRLRVQRSRQRRQVVPRISTLPQDQTTSQQR
jgi:tRNA(Ile2) C34 agmatinyltransferase TiaS